MESFFTCRMWGIATSADTDCAGVSGGSARIDLCGNCVGGTTGESGCLVDCNGVPGGSATEDNCGQCVGGDTGQSPCDADCNGDYYVDSDEAAYLDDCGTCVEGPPARAPASSTVTATNTKMPSTAAYLDACDICVGGLTGLEPCERDCRVLAVHPPKMHGVCDDDPTNDNLFYPDGTPCPVDCAGELFGSAVMDACGVCDDDPSNDNTVFPSGVACPIDCSGVANGPNAIDDLRRVRRRPHQRQCDLYSGLLRRVGRCRRAG